MQKVGERLVNAKQQRKKKLRIRLYKPREKKKTKHKKVYLLILLILAIYQWEINGWKAIKSYGGMLWPRL